MFIKFKKYVHKIQIILTLIKDIYTRKSEVFFPNQAQIKHACFHIDTFCLDKEGN